jgi:sigma-E factor negative regulatory protein RseB
MMLLCALAAPLSGTAQTGAARDPGRPAERSIGQWLIRMHEASRHGAYAGTFVVSSATGGMSSSRIWHVCDGTQQVERVDALTGAPRSTYRHNDQVVTFLPHNGLVLQERRDSLRLFSDLLQNQDAAIADFYSARLVGTDRVAGVDADVLVLAPRDSMRYGYRVWSERESGLVVKLQTLDNDGRILEQSAFSDLQLDAHVNMAKLIELMGKTQGYRVERLEPVPTTAAAEGWTLKPGVAGFKLMSCLHRPFADVAQQSAAAGRTIQWIFSDGLASVSLFVEPLDRQGDTREVSLVMGATRLLSRRVLDEWLTVVGEVPQQTLQIFSRSLERLH